MRALERWGEGRFKPIVMLGQVVALSASACHEWVLRCRGKSLLELPEAKGISMEQWLRLYRQQSLTEGIIFRFLNSPEPVQVDENTPEEYRAFRQVVDFEFSEEVEGAVYDFLNGKTHNPSAMLGEKYYRQMHLPMLQQMLSDNEPVPANFREWFRLPEMIFFLGVVAPCWVEFQRTPWTLYRRVCRGGWREAFTELEQLVRIDPEVVKDTRIGSVVFEMRKQNAEGYKLLQQAARDGCKGAVNLDDVKYLLGGLLMRWSKELQPVLENLHFELMAKHALPGREAEVQQWIKRLRKQAARNPIKCWLKAPDIKELFDAVAQDTGRGLVDDDFKGQPNSIYKRLSHNANAWPMLREADVRRAA